LDDEGDEMEGVVYTDDSKKEESIPSSLPPSKTLTASASQQQLVQAQKLQHQQQQQLQQLQHQQQQQLQQLQQLHQQSKYQVQVTSLDKPSFDQTSTHRRAPGLTRSHSSGVGSTLTNHHRKAKSDLGLQDFDRSSLLQSPKPHYPLPDPKLGITPGSQMSDSIMTTDGFPSQPDLGSRNFRRVQSGTDLSGLRTSRSETGLIPVSSLPVGSAPRPTGPAKKFSFRSVVVK